MFILHGRMYLVVLYLVKCLILGKMKALKKLCVKIWNVLLKQTNEIYHMYCVSKEKRKKTSTYLWL